MKYMLLIHLGDTRTPPSDEWERLSADEQKAVYADYKAISETRSVSRGVRMQPPEAATTVRVIANDWNPANMTDGSRTGQLLTAQAPAPCVGWL